MKKLLVLSLMSFLLLSVAVYAAPKDKAKIAVAANGKTAVAPVSNLAARSPYYTTKGQKLRF
jgi:hypothetical protein